MRGTGHRADQLGTNIALELEKSEKSAYRVRYDTDTARLLTTGLLVDEAS